MDQIGRAGNSDLKYHVGIINSFTECYLGEMKEVCKKSARKNLERRGFQEIPELSSKHR